MPKRIKHHTEKIDSNHMRMVAENEKTISKHQRSESIEALEWGASEIDRLNREILRLIHYTTLAMSTCSHEDMMWWKK